MEDKQIIQLYIHRDEMAIHETENKYGKRLLALSKNITDSQLDAQECMNDTLMDAWKRIPPTIPLSLFAYLAKVVRHYSLDVCNKRNAQKRSAQRTLLTNELDACAGMPTSQDLEGANKIELQQTLSAFLRRQSAVDRDIFMRRYFFGDSISDIANDLKLSENKITTKLFRIRKKLKETLEKEYYL